METLKILNMECVAGYPASFQRPGDSVCSGYRF